MSEEGFSAGQSHFQSGLKLSWWSCRRVHFPVVALSFSGPNACTDADGIVAPKFQQSDWSKR